MVKDNIFDKVLHIGPVKGYQGGISMVMLMYSQTMDPFHHVRTNHKPSAANKAWTFLQAMALLPVERMKGRKIAHIHHASGNSWTRKKILNRWARVLGYKVLMHCHAGAFPQFAKEQGYENINKVLRKSARNIVLSSSWENFFTNTLGLQNVVVVNNIVTPPDEGFFVKSNDVRDDSRFTLLFLGSLITAKGILDLMHAMAKVKASNPSVRLIVGGEGPQRDEMLALIESLHLKDNVEWRGWMSGEDKTHAFAESHAMVLPSYIEGVPITVLEAMAYRRAVLTTPVGGIPDVIEDGRNGLLVEPGNVDALAQAILRLASDAKLRTSLVDAAATDVRPHYPDQVAARLRDLYKEILP